MGFLVVNYCDLAVFVDFSATLRAIGREGRVVFLKTTDNFFTPSALS
jgi:hypothetical protein